MAVQGAFDLLVVGGGINGAGIARDAAGRGLRVLLAIAPHLVRRMRFVLPFEQRLRPAWLVRLGLFFYDHLALGNTLERSTNVRFATSNFAAPLRTGLRRGFAYSDCTVDDSRLVILNAKDAAERGAVVRAPLALPANCRGKSHGPCLWNAYFAGSDRRGFPRGHG